MLLTLFSNLAQIDLLSLAILVHKNRKKAWFKEEEKMLTCSAIICKFAFETQWWSKYSNTLLE